jgi:demethylmenaquinone methyltransferase/2-methoxy-6-polyprenyl-1,4-benzoquinol methylase
MPVKPYQKKSANDKQQVKSMFNRIAGSYDFLNHMLSAGIDRYWRKKTIGLLKKKNNAYILDVATGTADLAIRAYKALNHSKIVGIDISEKMLEIARQKIRKNMIDRIELLNVDAENMFFEDNTFDAAIVAFGVRNFENPEKGLSEIYRVLKPSGQFVVLEFSRPKKFPVRQLYGLYFRNLLPVIGKVISKDASAYRYLPESVYGFPEGNDFLSYLSGTGFVNLSRISLTFGIASVYVASKPLT